MCYVQMCNVRDSVFRLLSLEHQVDEDDFIGDVQQVT